MVRRTVRELRRALLDLVLPTACPLCGSAAEELCETCRRQLHWRPRAGCRRCGQPAMPGRETCGGSHAELRGVERLVAPWFFAGAGGGLVRRFKLDGDRAAGQLVVRAMANAWRESARGGWRRAVLVSVPLHPDRLRQRGFDQAQWLAAGIARRLRQPLVMGALRRQRATLPQGDPRVTSRSRNVEGAFAVHRADAVQGRQVLLVDDVFTSGTTAVECARILREAGAREVAVLVACRS